MTSDLIAKFTKRYPGGATVSIDLTQSIHESSVTVLFGPSGCGKTTLLRCLAGLTHPDEGQIEFAGETWFASDRKVALSPQKRDIGFLFQDYALFPHLDVADNIGFGLQSHPLVQRRQSVAEMLEKLDLRGLEKRYPRELSSGQQQRVALARSLVRRPKLLLLDEPLSALDSFLREQLRGELRRLFAELKTTVIFVTHDRVEAIALADRIAAMDGGSIQQFGSVREVFSRPKSEALARLIGVETIVAGEVTETHDGLATVRVGTAQLLAVAPPESSRYVHVCIRGEDVALQKGFGGSSSVRNHLTATIKSLTSEGPLVRLELDCGFEMTSLITRPACEELQLNVGDAVTAMLKAPAIHLIPRSLQTN